MSTSRLHIVLHTSFCSWNELDWTTIASVYPLSRKMYVISNGVMMKRFTSTWPLAASPDNQLIKVSVFLSNRCCVLILRSFTTPPSWWRWSYFSFYLINQALALLALHYCYVLCVWLVRTSSSNVCCSTTPPRLLKLFRLVGWEPTHMHHNSSCSKSSRTFIR